MIRALFGSSVVVVLAFAGSSSQTLLGTTNGRRCRRRPDGIWDTVWAERASTLIKEYIKKLKASEAALPPEQRLCDEVLKNQILDKFVEFSGGKKKGHIQGQGCTSSFIQRTPAGYIDVSSRPFNNSSMSIDRFAPAPVESREEFEQRIRADTQESMKKLREDILQEVTAQRVQDQYQNSNSFSNNSGNQSNQQQRRQHHQSSQSNQQNFQRQQQQHRRSPPVQQNQAIGRNSMSSSHQQDHFIEDENRPQNVDFMDTNQSSRFTRIGDSKQRYVVKVERLL
ncbi:hypothetical protein P8452_09404 [Trifolium repens]|nr:hypothetical protein P8452_09404 [Trifolium repens]